MNLAIDSSQAAAARASAQALPPSISAQDQARAGYYALLGRLFSSAPDSALLDSLAGCESLAGNADTDFARAWRQLCGAALLCEAGEAGDEFDALFIGVGKPEVVLHGSYYMAGFMMEKPLARLRQHLAELGLARRSDVSEPEDHICALAEVMRHLICDEAQSPAQRSERQKAFFVRHLRPWYAALFDQIESKPAANFYRRVAQFGHAFLDLDRRALEIEV